MLLLAVCVKLVAEVALLALVGQGLLALLAGPRRAGNPFYRLLSTLTRPFCQACRACSPRRVLDRHIPLATGFVLAWLWVGALALKVQQCRAWPGQALCA